MYSLNFARWFNGTTVCDPVGKDVRPSNFKMIIDILVLVFILVLHAYNVISSQNKVAQCKMEMFYQALGMKENKGSRPLMDIQRARAETTYSLNDDSD